MTLELQLKPTPTPVPMFIFFSFLFSFLNLSFQSITFFIAQRFQYNSACYCRRWQSWHRQSTGWCWCSRAHWRRQRSARLGNARLWRGAACSRRWQRSARLCNRHWRRGAARWHGRWRATRRNRQRTARFGDHWRSAGRWCRWSRCCSGYWRRRRHRLVGVVGRTWRIVVFVIRA